MIRYEENRVPSKSQVLELYHDANWTAYTNDPENLLQALHNSLYVFAAFKGEQLVGLIRVVGDAKTIIYIQDILVLKACKRKGIGKELVLRILKRYEDVRQVVLLTDDNPETRGFYEALNFESCDQGQLVAFVRLKNKK